MHLCEHLLECSNLQYLGWIAAVNGLCIHWFAILSTLRHKECQQSSYQYLVVYKRQACVQTAVMQYTFAIMQKAVDTIDTI